MAVTYGFYNSLNKDRVYNAEQMSSIFNGIITDGVFASIGGSLMPIAGTGMQVVVKTGKCWFNSTWTLNDALLPLDIPAADVSLTRIDAIVVEINSAVNARANTIKMVKGTPSANPAKPALANTETLHQYALGYVTVSAGATSITADKIEVNVGKTTCPFITSVLQQTDINDLFNQWDAEFNTWFRNVQSQLSGNIAANLQRQIDENYANTLKPSTKTIFGLSEDAVPDDAFNALNIVAKKNFNALRYTEFLTSGVWVAPSNLGNNGDIWIFGIGGGGGGGLRAGGGSGHMALRRKKVTPGESYTIVIGAGGAGSSGTAKPNGGAGGASSFGGNDFFSVLGGSGGQKYNGGNGGAGGGAWGGSAYDVGTTPSTGGDGQLCGGGGGGGGGVNTGTKPRSGGNGGKFGGGGGAGPATYEYNYGGVHQSTGGIGGANGGDGGNNGSGSGNGYAGSSGTHGELPFAFALLQAHLTGCDSVGGSGGRKENASDGGPGGGGGGYGSHGGDGKTGGAGGGGYFGNGGAGGWNGSKGGGGGGGFFADGGDGGNSSGGVTSGGGGGYFGHGGDANHIPIRGAGGAGGDGGDNAYAQAGGSGVIAIWYFVENEEALNEI